jgi:NTP pyrophosphatase (non-canonical NTP hydrolase)
MALDPINTHSSLPLGKLQEEVHDWISKHGVRYFNELTNMAQLTEEVGEVAEMALEAEWAKEKQAPLLLKSKSKR